VISLYSILFAILLQKSNDLLLFLINCDIIYLSEVMNVKCFFDTCNEAGEYATREHSFGIYYSNVKNQKRDIHIHDCCELFFCVSGGGSFLIDDKVYDIKDGDIFAINQFEAHKVSADTDAQKPFCRYILHVHPIFLYSNSCGEADLSSGFYDSDRRVRVSLSNDEKNELITLFESLRHEEEWGDRLYKRLRATELLLYVNKKFAAQTNSAEMDSDGEKALKLAIEYINENFCSDLTLDMVAKSSFVSAGQLCKLFSKYCGTTVTKYIVGKRIAEAKKLLSNGKNVTETAFACGFNNYAHFIKTFKKAVGVPPGKYKGIGKDI
jgi:AraC-like DNA-binding protein